MTVREIHEEWNKFYEQHREEFIQRIEKYKRSTRAMKTEL